MYKPVIYQMFLRAFTAEGTLAAAEKLLCHIASLGVDFVYLCPIAESDSDGDYEHWSDRQKASGVPNPRNPYRIGDYFKIDEEYGSDGDLKRFVSTAHRLGLRVMLDLVYFHCGPCAPMLKEHPEYTYTDENGSIIMGNWHFPKLNFTCEGLCEHLWANMEYFVREFDVDGYRCDVGDGVPLDFWRESVRRVKILKPDLYMLNEGSNPSYAEVFDSSYGFSWSHNLHSILLGKAKASQLRTVHDEYKAKFGSHPTLTGFDNHDIANDAYSKRGTGEGGYELTQAALFACLTSDGVPFIYNGNEICDSNRHSIFYSRAYVGSMTIDWQNALTDGGRETMAITELLCDLRRTEPALSCDELEWLDAPEDALAYTRGGEFFAAVNLSKRELSFKLPVNIGEVIISRRASCENGDLNMSEGGMILARLQ